MCNFCKKLIECPVGEKRKAVLARNTADGCNEKMEIVLDRYPDKAYVFIHSTFTEPVTGEWHNIVRDISCCPMCGKKLN